jgi:uncharacterized repeat protein (TIGR04138 family)
MATGQSETDWKAMLASAGPYPLEAFVFVRDGLSHTVERVHREQEAADAGIDPSTPGASLSGDPSGNAGVGPSGADAGAIEGDGGALIGRMQSDSRHVTGQQLCVGLRDFAIRRYGMMAPAVLRAWNLRSTDDFGRIVFAMIDHGLMSKTAEDSLEDFRSVFDFDEAFSRDELVRQLGQGMGLGAGRVGRGVGPI